MAEQLIYEQSNRPWENLLGKNVADLPIFQNAHENASKTFTSMIAIHLVYTYYMSLGNNKHNSAFGLSSCHLLHSPSP